jgi:4-hydroxybenzoate polyprenyltransferase
MEFIKNIVFSIRIKQWIKNFFVFIPLVFSQLLFHNWAFWTVSKTFFIFCLISSAIYLLNDVIDREQDRKHPVKSKRPIASGALSPKIALIVSFLFLALSLFFAFQINKLVGGILLFYFFWNLLYSFYFKKIVLVDIFAVSMNYLLRVYAGAVSISVAVSPYLFLMILSLSLLVSSGKRKEELSLLREEAINHRSVLGEYNPLLLDQLVLFSSILTTTIYLLYTVAPETVEKFGTYNLIYTTPLVLYGVMRYLYLVIVKKKGSPTEVFTTDKPLFLSVLLWGIISVLIVYFKI